MKVALVQHGIFPGFVAPIPKELAKHLVRIGVDVEVVIVGRRSDDPAAEQFSFPVHAVEAGNAWRVYRQLRERLQGADIVHYFPGRGLELLPFICKRGRCLFNHISVSVTGQAWRDRAINFGKRLQPLLAARVICTDEALASALRPVRPTPVSLLPVGYPDDLFFPCPLPAPTDIRRLVYHGAVRPQRRLEVLVHAVSKLPEQYVLTIIGGGSAADEAYRRDLGALARRLGCATRVELTNMSQAAIRQVICDSYLGLSFVPMLDCYQDQFVLKTLEFLACHRPVLASATRYTKAFSQRIGHGRLLLTDGSVPDLVEKLLDSEGYVRRFFEPDNLDTLDELLPPYSSRRVVEDRLLPLYRELLAA
jgi:glycosyltransferase involved in cell wall biosynthesis